MPKQFLVIGFIAVFWSSYAYAFACIAKPIQKIENLGKVVAIRLEPGTSLTESKKSSWFKDDDGMLVIGLIASACVEGMPQLELKLENEQSTCFLEAQDKAEKRIPDTERLHTNFYDPKFRDKTLAQGLISAKCGIDAIQLWETAIARENQIDLPCIRNNPNLKALLNRAVKRNEEYFEERTSPQFLNGVKISSDDKKEYVAKRKEELQLSRELRELLSSTLNVGAFRKWFESFKKMAPFKGYQILDAPVDSDHPETQTSLANILSGLGAKVGPVNVFCKFPTDKDIGSILSSANWNSAGVPPAPAATPAPAQEAAQ